MYKINEFKKRDLNFYPDLGYYATDLARLPQIRNKATEKRINRRLKEVESFDTLPHMSDFKNEVYKFCMEIVINSDDPYMISHYFEIYRHPELAKEELKNLKRQINGEKLEHQKVLVLNRK